MSPTEVPRFGLKFLSRKERTVRRVTKCETRNIQKRLEPPKPVYEKPKPKPKPKPVKLPKSRPATLTKADRPLGPPAGRRGRHPPRTSDELKPKKRLVNEGPRVLQKTDLEKLARLNCSREFSLFHQFIKNDLAASFENQLAFLQTKLRHLKNEFVNKQGEHLNFEQIRDYFNQEVEQHVRRQIKSDEYLTLSEKYRQDIKIAIDKWIRQKEIKPQKQVTEFLLRRQEKIRQQIKETMEQQKRQKQTQQSNDDQPITSSQDLRAEEKMKTKVQSSNDDDIMILD